MLIRRDIEVVDRYHPHVSQERRELLTNLCGEENVNLQHIELETGVQINKNGTHFSSFGGNERSQDLVQRMLHSLCKIAKDKKVTRDDILGVAEAEREKMREDALRCIPSIAQDIEPRNPSQKAFVEAIWDHQLTIGSGSAGTGKTCLAIFEALAGLRRGDHDQIIITRPMVEAGDSIGYLPGDIEAKAEPYMRPIIQ